MCLSDLAPKQAFLKATDLKKTGEVVLEEGGSHFLLTKGFQTIQVLGLQIDSFSTCKTLYFTTTVVFVCLSTPRSLYSLSISEIDWEE